MSRISLILQADEGAYLTAMTTDTKLTLFFFAYMGGALYSILSITTEFNQPFILGFKYLSLPMFILSAFIVFKWPHAFIRRGGPLKTWKLALFSLLFGGLLTLFSGPYLSLANAVMPPQEKVIVQGRVTGKFKTGKYQRSRVVTLDTENDFGRPYKFYVSHNYFDRVRIGDIYKTTVNKGGLGFVYRWK